MAPHGILSTAEAQSAIDGATDLGRLLALDDYLTAGLSPDADRSDPIGLAEVGEQLIGQLRGLRDRADLFRWYLGRDPETLASSVEAALQASSVLIGGTITDQLRVALFLSGLGPTLEDALSALVNSDELEATLAAQVKSLREGAALADADFPRIFRFKMALLEIGLSAAALSSDAAALIAGVAVAGFLAPAFTLAAIAVAGLELRRHLQGS